MKYPMRSRDFTEFTIGTQGSLIAQIAATKIDGSRLQGCSIRKLRWKMGFFGKTAGANEGPLAYGFSKSLTIAEIAECFAADPQSSQDDAQLEQSRRNLLVVGIIDQIETESSIGKDSRSLKNAKWPGWPIIEGESWNHFIFNLNPSNALTTGMFFQMYTEVYGDWGND